VLLPVQVLLQLAGPGLPPVGLAALPAGPAGLAAAVSL
jgi:hypothetical protein